MMYLMCRVVEGLRMGKECVMEGVVAFRGGCGRLLQSEYSKNGEYCWVWGWWWCVFVWFTLTVIESVVDKAMMNHLLKKSFFV